MKNLLALLILGCILSGIACRSSTPTVSSTSSNSEAVLLQVADRVFGKVYEPTNDELLRKILSDAKKEDVQTLIFFSMNGCPYCDRMEPTINRMAKGMEKVLFLKVKLEKCPSYINQNGVRSFPTFMVVDNPRKIVGATSEQALRGLLK